MNKSLMHSTFLPAETTLLSSIQRAKQRIFSKSTRAESNANTNVNANINTNTNTNTNNSRYNVKNDENNSLNSNIQQQTKIQMPEKVRQQRRYTVNSTDKETLNKESIKISQQIKRQKSTSQINQPSSTLSQFNVVAANAMKLLQQKIQHLQKKNKLLEQKLESQQQVKFQERSSEKSQSQQQYPSTSQKSQSYLLLKQQCQTLQKENASLCQQLYKQREKQPLSFKKESGRKLNFHHQVSQNISHVFQVTTGEQKCKELEEKNAKLEQQLTHFKTLLQNERKKNFTILKLHQEEIIKNEELQLQLNQLKFKVKQLQQPTASRKRKSVSDRRGSTGNHYQNLQSQSNAQIRQSVIRQKNVDLQRIISVLKEELQSEKIVSQQKSKQVTEIERRYFEVKESFIELYKDLTKYHPEVINPNIKFLYDRIRKGEDIMLRSRSIWSNRFGKLSQTKTNNRLSEFRSKSGKKGLKMEDLNSSKRSHSRDRTNSKNSHQSITKSNYRSPYAQQNLTKRNPLKSALSPNDKQRNRATTALNKNNKAKLSQIQKIIKEIKQVSKEIKSIKTEHRNLIVKLGTTQNNENQMSMKGGIQSQRNQERMNELIEQYNERNSKLQELKQQKDRLAFQTVPVLL